MSTRQCESFIRQSKNVECLLEEYLQMKVKELLNLDGPRKPHSFLNIVFPMSMFYGFSLPGNFLSSGVLLLKMQTYYSYLPFIVILKKNSFQREFWVEKVTVLWSEANFGPCQTSVIQLLCKKSQQLKDIAYFRKKLHHWYLTGF